MSGTDEGPIEGGRGRRSLRQRVTTRLRRTVGTEDLSSWKRDVQNSLDQLRAQDSGLLDGQVVLNGRIANVERGIGDVQATARTLEVRREDVQRVIDVLTFEAWLALERPETDLTITVVTATRNRASLLHDALASVLAQRHERWELVVVDDGSTDDTQAMLAQFTDDRIHVLHSDHMGVCGARNLGLDHATGDVVAYLDDDNLFSPSWLQAVAWAFDRSPDVDVVYGARVVDDRSALYPGDPSQTPWIHFAGFDREHLSIGNFVDMNVIAHRRDHAEAHFDERLSTFGDWELFSRLTASRDPLELPALACAYRTTAADRLSDRPVEQSEQEWSLAQSTIAEARRSPGAPR